MKFLEAKAAMFEVKHGKPTASVLKEIAGQVAIHRVALLREWEAKVKSNEHDED